MANLRHPRAVAGGTNQTHDTPLPRVAPLNAARTAQAHRLYLEKFPQKLVALLGFCCK